MSVGIQYYNDQMQRSQPLRTVFMWEVTAAKTVSSLNLPFPGIVSFDAISQANIDAALGSSSEFTTAQFDATAMGDDMFGGVIDFGGQMDELVSIEVSYCEALTLAMDSSKDSGLTDSTAATEADVSSSGNLGFRALLNLLTDGATALDLDGADVGIIKVEIFWKAK